MDEGADANKLDTKKGYNLAKRGAWGFEHRIGVLSTTFQKCPYIWFAWGLSNFGAQNPDLVPNTPLYFTSLFYSLLSTLLSLSLSLYFFSFSLIEKQTNM